MAISGKYNTPNIADNLRVGISEYVNGAAGDADYIVYTIPRNGLVTIKAVDIATAFSGTSTGTLTIGYKENGSAIQASGIAADSVTLSEATGIKSINVSRHFPKGGVITLGVTKGNSSTDIKARIFFECYVVVT